MIVIIDSNIVFSAILNSQSKIGQLIINSSNIFRFYTVSLLKDEIERHKDKLLSISGFTDEQYQNSYQKIIRRINFVDDILIPDDVIEDAINLVADIDENDILFVALTNHLHAKLWTGDKKLISGLKVNGFSKILTTNDMYDIFLEKQVKSSQRRR
jgi:predicted nucleic acid-binding protein